MPKPINKDTLIGIISMYLRRVKNVIDIDLNGDVVYSLRNSLLHSGNPSIERKKLNINKFELRVQKSADFNFFICCTGQIEHLNKTKENHIYVDIGFIIEHICLAAKLYYKENKEKFNFFDYKIVDINLEIQKMKELKKFLC